MVKCDSLLKKKKRKKKIINILNFEVGSFPLAPVLWTTLTKEVNTEGPSVAYSTGLHRKLICEVPALGGSWLV